MGFCVDRQHTGHTSIFDKATPFSKMDGSWGHWHQSPDNIPELFGLLYETIGGALRICFWPGFLFGENFPSFLQDLVKVRQSWIEWDGKDYSLFQLDGSHSPCSIPTIHTKYYVKQK